MSWILEASVWFFLRPAYRLISQNYEYESFSIGITTFMDRYEKCLKPIVNKLTILFSNCQILVIANGHVKEKEQCEYLKSLTAFCAGFKNLELIAFSEPKGLSHLWNQIILNSRFNKILILNDDLKIKMSFARVLNNSNILNHKIAVINSSWSHFLISKEIFSAIGPFDENLSELGGEDDDYAARLAINSIDFDNFKTTSISGIGNRKRKYVTINSYGKDMTREQGGYSTKNSEYLKKKWETSNQFFEGAVFVPNRNPKFWKLKNPDL